MKKSSIRNAWDEATPEKRREFYEAAAAVKDAFVRFGNEARPLADRLEKAWDAVAGSVKQRLKNSPDFVLDYCWKAYCMERDTINSWCSIMDELGVDWDDEFRP